MSRSAASSSPLPGLGNATAKSGSAKNVDYSIAGSGGIDAKDIDVRNGLRLDHGRGRSERQGLQNRQRSIMGAGNVELTGGAKCSVSKVGPGTCTARSDLLTIVGREWRDEQDRRPRPSHCRRLRLQAMAAERTLSVTTFDRVRIDGPYKVKVTTGVSPFAKVSGSASGDRRRVGRPAGPHPDRPTNPSDLGRLSRPGRGLGRDFRSGRATSPPPGSTARARSRSTRSRDCRSISPFRARGSAAIGNANVDR